MGDSGGVNNATDQWALIAALSEPQRRAVYDAVCQHARPVTREEVGDAVGISRSLAAFHLDKLVDVGLLEADAKASAGRPLRKIGRPAKRYQRSALQVDLTLPTRRYGLAGRILAAALAAAEHGEPPVEAARRIAHEQGRDLARRTAAEASGSATAEPLAAAQQSLQRLGYAPAQEANRLTLGNCPFHAIVQVAPQVTCGLNLAFIDGLLVGLGVDADVTAALEPAVDACCVTLARQESSPAEGDRVSG